MMAATTWLCRRCKVELPDYVDADWHNVATGHNYFVLTQYGGRPQLIDWRRQMRCPRAAANRSEEA